MSFKSALDILRSHFSLQSLAAFLSGCLAALSMAPANFWPVLFVALPIFYMLLCLQEAKTRGFLIGWLFGFGYFLCSLSWIGSAVLVEGNGYKWAYPLAVAGIPFGLAFFTGFAGLCSVWHGQIRRYFGFIAFTIFLIASEWLRGHMFTGFPWNLFGYTWADHLEIAQVVSFSDIYFLSWLTIFWCALPGYLIVTQDKKLPRIALACLAVFSLGLSWVYGSARLQNPELERIADVNIKIVPGDIAQSDKWIREKLSEHFYAYIEQSKANKNAMPERPTIIVWPETAIVNWFYEVPEFNASIKDMLRSYKNGAVLLTGVLRRNGEKNYNSLIMIDQDGRVSNAYDKSHLVPFGEYIPFQNYIPLKPVNNFSGFQAGQGPVILETPFGVRYAPAICYEIIFPHSLIPHGEPKPDFIVNVTNDAWYDGSAGPEQHHTNVFFRAIEYKTPIIRVSNKGVSSVILPTGRALTFKD